ncbi:MAG: penicillin-binding protein 2, partial [Synergistaceae bacterium]|nr:penicillin-binding protein 2 [Synergistaceae bacterium]
EELERHPEYKGGDHIGKNGIEACYEDEIHGMPGERVVEVDAKGRQVREISYTASVKGKNIKLTIDLGAQRYASKLLQNFRGAIVALDVTDGSVKCLVSSPSYDPNPLTWGITGQEWVELLDKRSRPMMNRAISGAYPPASTFKVVTASAALSNKKITTSSVVHCPGYFELGNRRFRCWNHAGHGNETVVKALRDSCDVFFYQTAWSLGIDRLIETASKFGVGKKTGVDLTSESSGTLAGPKWKKKKIKENWYGGDTVNYSIGQGYLLMTPLQVARVYAAVASKGKLFRPKINSALPVEYKEVDLSDDIFRILQQGLQEVGSTGTGRAASEYGVRVAGKTGTAQNSHGADHAWFAGYAPVDNPRYAVVAIAEAGKGGGKVTGPMVGKMLNYLINHKEKEISDDEAETEEHVQPNVTGESHQQKKLSSEPVKTQDFVPSVEQDAAANGGEN